MATKHLMGLSCTIDELPSFLKEYCKKYGKEMGTEISVRFGYDEKLNGDKYKACAVFVSRTLEDTGIRGGSHYDFYNHTD